MENIVWSWNEWGRLKEVVLGNATGSAVVGACHPAEQAKTFHLEEKLSRFVGMRPKEKVDAAAAELDNFGRILEVLKKQSPFNLCLLPNNSMQFHDYPFIILRYLSYLILG